MWIECAEDEDGHIDKIPVVAVSDRKTHSGAPLKSNPDYVRFCDLLTNAKVSEKRFEEALKHEQGTPEWVEDRKLHVLFDGWPVTVGRFSGSTVSCHFGLNKYKSGKKHAHEMVHGSTFDGANSPPCQWGHGAEPWAEAAFDTWIQSFVGTVHQASGFRIVAARLDNFGMILHRNCARRGYSPDGVLAWTVQRPDGSQYEERELVEYKCPWGKRDLRDFTSMDIYNAEHIKKLERVYAPIPSMYACQQMYGMYLLKRMKILTRRVSHFVTWFPAHDVDPENPTQPVVAVLDSQTEGSVNVQTFPHGAFQYTRLEFDEAFTQKMIAACEKNWRKLVLPQLWMKLLADQRASRVVQSPTSDMAQSDGLPWMLSETPVQPPKRKRVGKRRKDDFDDEPPIVIPAFKKNRADVPSWIISHL